MTTSTDSGRGTWLVIVAAPVEAAAACRSAGVPPPDSRWRAVTLAPGLELAVSGVGKVNAAACLARTLTGRHRGVLSVGLCGALPGSGLSLGDAVVASECAYADEGIVTPGGFRDCGQMGFPLGKFSGRSVRVSPEVIARLQPLADRTGPIATVSTCSGTDEAAATVVERTGAIAEAMEGAAVAHVADELGVLFGELRFVSNTTGDREAQRWDVTRAASALERALGRLPTFL